MIPLGRRFRPWWARRSIRFRLSLWYAAGGTALLALFATTLYFFVAARMGRPLDHQLRADLRMVEQHLTVTAAGTPFWQGEPIGEPAAWMTDHPWFELWDEQDRLVTRVWPFVGNRVLMPPGPPSQPAGTGTLSVFNVAPDLRLRALSVPWTVAGRSSPWTLRLLRVHQRYADSLPDLQLIILVALPVVVALLVLGGHYFTRRWLLPLDRMAAEATHITVDDLDRRLPVVNPHDELGRLATVFNVTLDRLQNSFEALDRFVSDASHELRTPLTTLRSVGEVGLRKSRTVAEYRDIIGSMLEEAHRLHQLVERLLQLASAEGAAHVLHRSPTQLKELISACVQELGVLAEQRGQRLLVQGAACTAFTDPVFLRQAVQNLIDNAIKYGPEGSEIRVEIREQEEMIDVDVIDQGPGIAAADRAHLMSRFFRPDPARGRQSGGFGLGLAITKAYLRTLGGTLEYEPAEPQGSIFRLRLPKGKVTVEPANL